MKEQILTIITTSLLMANLSACNPQKTSEDVNKAESNLNETAVETQPSMQMSQGNLQTYDETANGIPVKAKYPNTMDVLGTGSGEGVGVFFNFKPQGNALDQAEIHFFLPAGAKTATEVETYVKSPNGLMASNGWTLVKGATPPQELIYPWVKKIITFSTDQEMMGHILLGEINDQGLQVILLYPAEMADAYWPAAKTVLESAEFDSNLLPIKSTDEELSVDNGLGRSVYQQLPLPQDAKLIGVEPKQIAVDLFGISEPVEGNFQEEILLTKQTNTEAIFNLIQTGLPDDSVAGMRYRLEFKREGEKWRLDWAGRQLRCYPNRGSQIWGTENCR
jgi:hypothetical protein